MMSEKELTDRLRKLAEIQDEYNAQLDNTLKDLVLSATDKGHKVALLAIFLDPEKYNKEHNGSCDYCVIPDLENDEHIRQTLHDLVDYIRKNYDCNKFVEV
ncbi:MAG: hypothetical protein ACI4EU_02935 [Butyrivibrio sp.]